MQCSSLVSSMEVIEHLIDQHGESFWIFGHDLMRVLETEEEEQEILVVGAGSTIAYCKTDTIHEIANCLINVSSGIFLRILRLHDGHIALCVIYISSCVSGRSICPIKGVAKFHALAMLNGNERLDVGILNCENTGNDSGMKLLEDIMTK